MENNNKIKKVLEFYMLTNVLKEEIRQGWIYWHIDKHRLESIAEHIYGVSMLAISIDSEYDCNINIEKVILMIALHELEEIIVGDITPHDDVCSDEKLANGREAVTKILDGMLKQEKYEELLNEFNDKQTNEAKFANMCDKLEADIQAKIYDERGYSNIHSHNNKMIMNSERIKKLLDKGAKNIADLFLLHDMPIFEGEFIDIAEYVKETELTKLNKIDK